MMRELGRRIGKAVVPQAVREAYHATVVRAEARRLAYSVGAKADPEAVWRSLQRFWRFRPQQREREIVAFMRRVMDLAPARICEIGAAGGGTAFMFLRALGSRGIVVSIDLNMPRPLEMAMSSWGRGEQRILPRRLDSHDPETVSLVRAALGGPLDVLFVDGDHSYAGVREDFDRYSPLVRPGGIIAFHDIVPDDGQRFGTPTPASSGGVPRFWQEVRMGREFEEYVDSYEQNGYGIGVLVWTQRGCEASRL